VKILRADCFGSRLSKFEFLSTNSLDSIKWDEIVPSAPNYEWVSRDEKIREEYLKGFSVSELFPISSIGIVTARDEMSIQNTRADIEKVVNDFLTIDAESLRVKYNLRKDTRDWKVILAKDDVLKNFSEDKFVPFVYRPFDTRWTFYTGNSKGFHCMPRGDTMRHFLARDNIGLLVTKQLAPEEVAGAFVTRYLGGHKIFGAFNSNYFLPLYLYSDDGSKALNLKKELVNEIEKIIGDVKPEDIFDYIYAILHSPSYRNKFNEFLKTDFPHIPYPKDAKIFNSLVLLGSELRSLHLLESQKIYQFITTYPVEGSDTVDQITYKEGNVFINKSQYFGNVPEIAWNFSIGGHLPAQKWLKDHKDRPLTNTEIEHYQKIIVVLFETDKLMKEIDKVDFW
jgi:predicted helicase